MTNPLRIAVRLRSLLVVVLALLGASSELLVRPQVAHAQTLTGTIIVRVTADTIPIAGAAVATGTASGVTDRAGLATFTLPTGRHTFRVTPSGFRPESLAVFVGVGMTRVTVALHQKAEPQKAEPQKAGLQKAEIQKAELPHVTVTASPSGHRASDVATNVEVINREAVEAQLDRSPGTVAELLERAPGVRIQPLSAGSAGVGIRIRGMPGRYAKILSDGLPLLGTTPNGLDPLQIPALGLERVELIPGVTSELAGPTALSGVVNLLSASPTSPSEVIVNGTTRKASDVAIWQTHTFSPQWAATLVAGRHYRTAGDPDDDGWGEVNGYKRVVVRPRVYWSRSERSSWFMTGGWTSENRHSGTFRNARLPDFNTFSDDANTRRADAGTVGRILLDTNTFLTIRSSLTREWRSRWYGQDRERNRRSTIFSDVALTKSLKSNVLKGSNVVVGGVSLERDQYVAMDERRYSYRYTTPALFAEHTWEPERRFAITSGARLDLHSEFGDFVSPRVAVVVRPSEAWTVRLSRASGVYAPTPMTDETAAFGLSNLRRATLDLERALGWSLDLSHVNGPLELRGSAYHTVVNHPLVLRTSGESLELVNADEPSRTQGIDFSTRYRLDALRFTAAYSYVDAMRPEIARIVGFDFAFDTTLRRGVPLTPRHAARLDAAYEEDDKIIGLELNFTGRQMVADTSVRAGRPYATLDARFEKHVRSAIVFVYGKNLTGVHQAQYASVLRRASGPVGQWTNDVWAPLDGRVINAGVRVVY